jgi:uncharacterized protein YjiS (DUF1127 family)
MARVGERLRLWWERRRWIGEMRDASALGRFGDVLKDTGISRADLGEMIEAPADAGRQFEALAEVEGVDVRQFPPEVLHEAIRVCIRCAYRGPCKRWLATGVWAYGEEARCPNTALLRH